MANRKMYQRMTLITLFLSFSNALGFSLIRVLKHVKIQTQWTERTKTTLKLSLQVRQILVFLFKVSATYNTNWTRRQAWWKGDGNWICPCLPDTHSSPQARCHSPSFWPIWDSSWVTTTTAQLENMEICWALGPNRVSFKEKPGSPSLTWEAMSCEQGL